MINLSQRGRAGLEFLGSLQPYASSAIRQVAKKDFEEDPDFNSIIHKHSEICKKGNWKFRIENYKNIAIKSLAYRYERFYQRYVAEENFVRAIPAIEERREEAEKFVNITYDDCGGSLELDKNLKIPKYYEGVDWHLEPGGWDGYDLASPMFMSGIGKYVFSRGGFAAVEVDDDIKNQRLDVTSHLPKDKYECIYEMGCGGAPATLSACKKNYPEAKLIGSDLSASLLKSAHNVANAMKIPIDYKQRDARNTLEPDESVDAVVMYALLHEMPVTVCIDSIKEAFRILKPGGDIIINDPPPFSAVDPFQAVILDWDTDNRGEPFFSETCAMEWKSVLEDVGFINSKSIGLGKKGYPWVDIATKPK